MSLGHAAEVLLSDDEGDRTTPPFAGVTLLSPGNAQYLRASIRSGRLEGRSGWTEVELLSYTKFVLTFEKQYHIVFADRQYGLMTGQLFGYVPRSSMNTMIRSSHLTTSTFI